MLDKGWVPAGAWASVFTARQAYAEGLTRRQVRHAVDSGRWRRLVGDALVPSTLVVTPRHLALGAVLTWPDATVAFGTAALVHRLPVAGDAKVHVIVPSRRPRRGALVPHLLPLVRSEVAPLGPGRITTRDRTVIDCLGRCARDESDRLLAWVASRDLLDPDVLERWLLAHPGALGNGRRRVAAGRLRSGAVNPAEERLHGILRRAGITGWRANVPLFPELGIPARADVYFAAVRLVIEVDGRAPHEARFQEDHTRQNRLVTAGCTVLRFTWQDLTLRPGQVAAEIRSTLALLHNLSA